MSKITFSESGWADYLYWQSQDKRFLKRINKLLLEIVRSGYAGTGKPEALKGELGGFWSRRIDEQNRLVYRISGPDADIEVISCRTHYGDK